MEAPPGTARIRDVVGVRQRPTVVTLEHLSAADAAWISAAWLTTPAIEQHLVALRNALAKDTGCGIFLIGQYGSGKSHFLAYVAQSLRAGRLGPKAPEAVAVSLLHWRGDVALEDIVGKALGIEPGTGDRRPRLEKALAVRADGTLLLLDELSEFLRSKPDARAYAEDVRFLQFLGEQATERRFWVVAAMQEQIEHTGDLDYGLWRKIKDRYPLRFLLTPAHVRDLIGKAILIKGDGYDQAVQRVLADVRAALPGARLDEKALADLYPIHPATLELLEEVRDRFSRTRGVVDFVTARLAGDPARRIEPFLDRPLGELLTPDAIVDHFRDVLEVQAEFAPLGQKLLPYYDKHLGDLFDRPAAKALAERVLKLLMLVWLSPEREGCSPAELAAWLLHRASRLEPDRNVEVVARMLDKLARDGRYVAEKDGSYRIDFADDDAAAFAKSLEQEQRELAGTGEGVFARIAPELEGLAFHPFRLPHGEVQHRRIVWRFHERRFEAFLGNETPPPSRGTMLCVRLPWGEPAPAPGAWSLVPRRIEPAARHAELLALVRLRERPWSAKTKKRIEDSIADRAKAFEQELKSAYVEGALVGPTGERSAVPPADTQGGFERWLEAEAEQVFRRTYPSFERFAPAHGPLAKEVLRAFARAALHGHLTDEAADDATRLVRDAYLVPMQLLVRQGRGYAVPKSLERHELVRLLLPMLEHQPAPAAVHAHLAQPVYGLVPDQVQVLLVLLAGLGEIDLEKGGKSYRDLCEMLPDTLQYERIVVGAALPHESVAVLEALCDGLRLSIPKQWTVLAQRRAIEALREHGRRTIDALQPLLLRLAQSPAGKPLVARMQRALADWRVLLGSGGAPGETLVASFERFLDKIGPVPEFLRRTNELAGLPARLERLLLELERFRHLFSHPLLARDGEGLARSPELDRLDEVEAWLLDAKARYERHAARYRDAHDQFWTEHADHPVWSYAPPPLARSRHVGVARELEALLAAQARARETRCRGLAGLEFQPVCRCGFGTDSFTAGDAIAKFESARRAVEGGIEAFFARKDVRRRLQAHAGEAGPDTGSISDWLEGRTAVPAVTDVAAFERCLAGVEAMVRVGAADLAQAFGPLPLDRDQARQAFESFLARLAPEARVRFEADAVRVPTEVTAFCLEQCLRHGVAWPAGIDLASVGQALPRLRPDCAGPLALARLDELGLPEGAADRVLEAVADGRLDVAPASDLAPSVRAARELVRPTRAGTAQELADLACLLYRADARLRRVAKQRWLARLAELAEAPLPEAPPPLAERLREVRDAQWLLVDCLGLAILPAVGARLEELCAAWQRPEVTFARVSTQTTTAACYDGLADAGLARSLEKIDAIDTLLHEAEGASFEELARLAVAALENALRRVLPRLDPARRLVVFADHGFRLAEDGASFRHGGPSTLERTVPVLDFAPR